MQIRTANYQSPSIQVCSLPQTRMNFDSSPQQKHNCTTLPSRLNVYLKPIFQTIYKLTWMMPTVTRKGSISCLLLLILVSATAPPKDEREQSEVLLTDSTDIDADGIISMKQFEQYMEPYIADIEQENWKDSKMDSYLSYDTDGDGIVSREQFSATIEGDLEEYPTEPELEDIDYQDQFRRHWWLKGQMTIQYLQEEGDQQVISIEVGEGSQVHSNDFTPQGIEQPHSGTDEL